MKLLALLLALAGSVWLTGCASKHAYMSHPEALGPEYWQCPTGRSEDCYLARGWQPPQLTPVGCIAHTLVTGGHVAWECRKPKKGKPAPTSGKWIW